MFSRNEITEANRWCYLIILLTGWVVFSSCVSSTLNTTGSNSLTDNEAYAEIKAIAGKLENSGDPAAYEMLVEKSAVFINAYPKYKRVDEVYYLLSTGLMQLDRIEEGIEVFEELIRYYPAADYVEPSLLTLGLAYDKVGEHEKADRLYEKWRQYWDNGGRISDMYNVRAIPSTFLIDGAGVVRRVNLRGSALEMAVAELVRENLEN